MNVHILIVDNEDGKSIESFASRTKMVSRKTALGKTKTTMMPPVVVPRSADGILYVANLINRLHTEDVDGVLKEMEGDYVDED